jgi:hypothetical protein
MTVAVLATPPSTFTDEQIEAVRQCLRQISDDDRAMLWNLMEALMRAIDAEDVSAVTAAVARAPDGLMRGCLAAIAKPFVDACRAAIREHVGTGVQLREERRVYGRAQPDFLGLFSGLIGTVAPVEVWVCRTGLYWEKTEADAFANVNTSRRWHDPKPLDYRHHAETVLGCSRCWGLGDDGALLGTFDMGSYPTAQHAARAAQRGDLGLSMSVRLRTRWLAHPSPEELNPATGDLDVCVRDQASVEACALTPVPTYPSATVRRVW